MTAELKELRSTGNKIRVRDLHVEMRFNMIKLPSFFSNKMILQKGTVENRIWGYAAPGAILSISLFEANSITGVKESSHDESIRADVQGYFSFLLPYMDAGGPWDIEITCEGEKKVLEDVYFGDVFLLGGQSNMELPLGFPSLKEKYKKEIETADFHLIRQFELPKEYDFNEKRKFMETGKWVEASGEDLLTFSAAGYFAAKEIYEKLKIPIGLYQAAVGGTPIKSWCSPETVQRMGYDHVELSECVNKDYVNNTIEEETKRDTEWREKAMEPFAADEKERTGFQIPSFFTGTELADFTGSLSFKKTVKVSEENAKKDAVLHFGLMIDVDEILVNGIRVGESGDRYLPRVYPLPSGTLHAGENEIEVRLLTFQPGGGFLPGKSYDLTFADGEKISLEGEWSMAKVQEMPPLPMMTFFLFKASGTYRAMLYPLQKLVFHGVFFYQGESNTERADTYEEEFTAMIEDWRSLFRHQTLPFVYVQLAGYGNGIEHTDGTDWAEIREAQRRCNEIPETAMVQAYDLGEYNDLHPSDKKELGIRIAEAAWKTIYEKKDYISGPSVQKIQEADGEMKIWFQGGELETQGEALERFLNCFEQLYSDGNWHPAKARLLGENAVSLEIPDGKKVTGVRYAWNDCPFGSSMYRSEKLPVIPFRATGEAFMRLKQV